MKILNIHNGCETNLYDSEKAKMIMLSRDCHTATNQDDADVIVFHSCTFTQQKEDESNNIIQDLLASTAKKVIVSGCFLKKEIKNEKLEYVKNETLPLVINEMVIKNKELKSKPVSSSPIPIIQISRGCYGSCSFCSIKMVKGLHQSRDINEIMIDIEAHAGSGTIKLVGDEVAGYGRDRNSNLKELITTVSKRFPGLKVKLGSLNAKLLKHYSDEEMESLSSDTVTGNVHIPIQSASNNVLKAMKRGYLIEEYVSIYTRLKKAGVKNISGDIICGFPTEDEADHRTNLDFISNYSFNFLEVFAYHERPGTEAAELPQINMPVREKRGIEILGNYLKNYGRTNGLSMSDLLSRPPVYNTNIKFSIT